MESSISRTFKKVTGERIVAAIIDSIIVSIVSSIPTFYLLFKDGFDAFVDNFVNSTTISGTSDLLSTGNLVLTTLFAFLVGFIYFAYVPFKWNGQTLGKKIMSIKAIDEFGNNPTLGKHSVRAVQIWDVYVTVLFLPLIFAGINSYSLVVGLLSSGVSLLVFISFILMLAKDDGRGIHDSMAGTYVVKANIDLNQQFVEKTTQMGDWAEVDYDLDQNEKKQTKDDWYD